MALQISTYVDPGVYIGEVVVPGAVNVANVPFQVGIIGPGSRRKRINNEAIVHGLVQGEDISPTNPLQAGMVSSPHIATLGGTTAPIRGTRRLQQTAVFRDGKALSDSFLTYQNATILGTVAATFGPPVAGTNDAISLSLDGKIPLTIVLNDTAGTLAVVNGSQVDIDVTLLPGTPASLAALVTQDVADAINEAFNPTAGAANIAVTALGYGAAYGLIAIDATTGVRITSPTSGPASDVRLFDPIAQTAVLDLFGAPVFTAGESNRDATTQLRIADVVFNAASIYTIDYIATADVAANRKDPTANSDTGDPQILGLLAVGSDPGIGNFTDPEDYQLGTGGDADLINWDQDAAAFRDGVLATAGSFNLSTNETIAIGFDGSTPIDIDIVTATPAPLGYVTIGAPATAALADIAANINAVLAASSTYGSRYSGVATVETDPVSTLDFIRITAPGKPGATPLGEQSTVTFATPSTAPADDAMSTIFGFTSQELPQSFVGTGREPAQGTTYFVSYEINRPSSDYNRQKRFFSLDQARADLGTENAQNPIMIAARLAFRNGAPSIIVVQVNDDSLPGSPTRNEFSEALDVTTETDAITEVCVLSTDLAVQIDLKDHIEQQSSPTEKHYRRGWFGMARNTDIGDRDTADSYVYRSTRTLQVGPTSPGRGRLILCAPPQRSGVSIDLEQDDGSIERVDLDSTYLAVAWAAKRTSFQNPSESLARKTVGGFNVDDIISPWRKRERQDAQRQGSMVTLFDAGNFTNVDPVTTEQGGGGLAAFNYPSTSSQKDNVTRRVTATLDANVVGVVPTDLADFIIDIKLFIQGALNAEIGAGSIAPFRDVSTGATRPLNIATDIEVEQDRNDPTKFFFRYFFFLKYPALRLFGEFSVDNPFFITQAA